MFRQLCIPLLALMLFGGTPGTALAEPPSTKSTLVDAAWKAYEAGDFHAAINGFKRLARDGIIKAQTNLGYMYAVGQGVDIDLVESAAWFRMAAEHGHRGAQVTLGLYYYNGEGVERDIVAAHAWFTMAVAAGHSLAPDYQALVTQQMSVQQLADAHAVAKKLYAVFGEKKNLR